MSHSLTIIYQIILVKKVEVVKHCGRPSQVNSRQNHMKIQQAIYQDKAKVPVKMDLRGK